jgi:outer membrane protein assembly factor BamB
MKRAFIFTSDAVFALYLIITILSILFLLSYEPTVHIEQSQNIAEDVVAVMGEYQANYVIGNSLYPYTKYLLNNGWNSSDWPMFHRSLAHDGYVVSAAPNSNLTFWSVNLTSAIYSSPAVYKGVIFVSSQSFTYAIDEATGIIIWSVPIGTNSSPAIADEKVFIGAPDNKTYALDRLTGKQVWNASTNGSISSSPAVHNGKVFIGSTDGYMYAFDEDSGTQIWNKSTGAPIGSSPAVAYGKVFFSLSGVQGGVAALDEDTGATIWKIGVMSRDHFDSSPAVSNDIVSVGEPLGTFIIKNATTGVLLWARDIGPMVSASPAVDGQMIFIGDGSGTVYAFRYNVTDSGNLIWQYNAGPNMNFSNSSPVVADGKVFIGSDTGTLFAINETTGNLIWSYSTGGGIQSSPAVANGRVYFGNKNGVLYSIGDCAIVDSNKTVLELIGEFWSINKTGCSVNLFQDIFEVGHMVTYSNKLLLRFNEGAGLTAADVTSRNNGILINSPNWTAGKIGKGLQFNGINQSVSVNSSPSVNNFTKRTIREMWMNILFVKFQEQHALTECS